MLGTIVRGILPKIFVLKRETIKKYKISLAAGEVTEEKTASLAWDKNKEKRLNILNNEKVTKETVSNTKNRPLNKEDIDLT